MKSAQVEQFLSDEGVKYKYEARNATLGDYRAIVARAISMYGPEVLPAEFAEEVASGKK